MNLPHTIPTLRILPVENLLLHENHDPSRLDSLKGHLTSGGFLRNPPVVAQLEDGAPRFVVLDGANRTIALKTLGIPHVIAQVVEPPGNIGLHAWNHVLIDTDADYFITRLRKISNLHVCHSKNIPDLKSENKEILAQVLLPTGEIFILSVPESSSVDKIVVLNHFERTCREYGMVERTSLSTLETLAKTYPKFSALVIYLPFEISTILSLAEAGKLLPAGITRFLISPRVLRVNYPIKELMASKSLAAKNIALQEWKEVSDAMKKVQSCLMNETLNLPVTIDQGLIRLSIWIEHANDLSVDLEQVSESNWL